jgi:non-canonical purine NTP pyrophosphatase (RdgB/HAM1 family)
MRILLATANPGKVAELSPLLAEHGFEIVGLGDIGNPVVAEEIETGSTFAENALLKARYYHNLSGLPTIGDDSGLEVDALAGAPGIYSARYGGDGASDRDRMMKLLAAIKDVRPENRGARFVCAAAIVWCGGERVFAGEARGALLAEPRGEGGFGYDPVFFYEPLGKTFAELGRPQKEKVSHRGRAFLSLVRWLKESDPLDTTGSSDKINLPAREPAASSIRGDL